MTPKQIENVERTWDFVVLNTTEAGKIFYNRLFEIDPKLRSLFKDNMESQEQKLISMITFVVHKLNNLNDVVKDVKALGERHKNYKVLPEYYNTVGAALLRTLEQALGPKWNDEVREAWTKAYTILSSTMIEAAAAKSKVA